MGPDPIDFRLVAGSVRDRKRDEGRGRSAGGKAAALEAREVLANAVDLVNVRSRIKERPRKSVFLKGGHVASRRRAKRRSPAGDQEKNEVVRLRRARQPHRLGGRIMARHVRNRVACFDEPDFFQGLAEPMPDHCDARQLSRRDPALVILLRRFGHPRRGLAAGDHNDFPACWRFREVTRQAFCRQRSGHGGIEKSVEEASGV